MKITFVTANEARQSVWTHSVLAVGSVATKELDAYGVYQGNPAILKRQRELKYV
jgi:acetyltransferase-like isoleucine patch superfamily enzyme